MLSKLTSIFLASTLLAAALLPPPVLAHQSAQTQEQQDKQKKKEEEKRRKEEEKRRKEEAKKKEQTEDKKDGGGRFGVIGRGIKRAGNAAKETVKNPKEVYATLTDPNRLMYQSIGAAFNLQLPIKLDASTAYKPIIPPTNFKPTALTPTLKNLAAPLKPGDYTVPVIAFCTRDSIHRPGRGLGYELAPLQGAQAAAMAALLARGTLLGVPHGTLQTISWSVQASIPYEQMPQYHQEVIDELIPDYREGLRGGFLQKVEDRYNSFLGKNSKVFPLDEVLEKAGVGAEIRNIRRSQEIIKRDALHYERLEQNLFDGNPQDAILMPASNEPASPWSEIRPGVYAQIIITNGMQGVNQLNLRVTPQAELKTPTPLQFQNISFAKAAYIQQQLPAQYPSPLQVMGSDIFTPANDNVARQVKLELVKNGAKIPQVGEAVIEATFRGQLVRAAFAAGRLIFVSLGAEVVVPALIVFSIAAAAQALIIALKPEKEKDAFEKVYRVYGGEAKLEGIFWTPVDPRTVPNYRYVAGLPPPPKNTGEFLAEGIVKTSDILERNRAKKIGEMEGGLEEYIINPANVKILKISPLKPRL